MENNTTMTYNCDEQTNHDLPGEIHEWTADPADQQFHDQLHNQTFPCGHYQERWWDWNDDVIGPNADEPVAGDEDWRQWDGTLSNEYEDEARSALVWGDEDWRQLSGTAEDGDC